MISATFPRAGYIRTLVPHAGAAPQPAMDTTLGGRFSRDTKKQNAEKKERQSMQMKSTSSTDPTKGEVADAILAGQWAIADSHRKDTAWLRENADLDSTECGLDFTQVKATNANLLYAVKFKLLLETVRNLNVANGDSTKVLDFSALLDSAGSVSQHVLTPRINMLRLATQPYANLRSYARKLSELLTTLDRGAFWQEALPPTASNSFTDHGA